MMGLTAAAWSWEVPWVIRRTNESASACPKLVASRDNLGFLAELVQDALDIGVADRSIRENA